jgi:hypothetical protein
MAPFAPHVDPPLEVSKRRYPVRRAGEVRDIRYPASVGEVS